jgi:hypothetical protein
VRIRAECLASFVPELRQRRTRTAKGRMMQGVKTGFDGKTNPMRFQRRGARKRILAADGSELAPNSKPQPDGTLVKALARAWRWQPMLDDGVSATVSEIGDAENISKSYASLQRRAALSDRLLFLALRCRRAGLRFGECARHGGGRPSDLLLVDLGLFGLAVAPLLTFRHRSSPMARALSSSGRQ